MENFKEFNQDWQKLKANTTEQSVPNWSRQNSQSLLEKLVAHEHKENRERKRGIIGGGLGLLGGLGAGVVLPVSMGILPLTPLMILGVVLMIGSLVFFFLFTKNQTATDIATLPTIAYLTAAKQKLLDRKQYLLKTGIGYVTLMLLGIACIFGDMEGLNVWWVILPTALWGVIVTATWRYLYGRKIAPLLAEIDALLKEME
ncbi:MAG: hypothetical protein AB8G15_02200 [Saprospiraceae bacterium]